MSLWLLPNSLGGSGLDDLPASLEEIVSTLKGLIAESFVGGQSFLKLCRHDSRRFPIAVLHKKMKNPCEYDFFLEPILENQEDWGFVSDAGLPCIADPGSGLVSRAYEHNILVKVVSGPCSITMALMLSGFYTQSFSFMGYFSREPKVREKVINRCFQTALRDPSSPDVFVFIEAPYRNEHSLASLLKVLPDRALLCVASGLTTGAEFVSTASIENWKKKDLVQINQKIRKQPAVFIFKSC